MKTLKLGAALAALSLATPLAARAAAYTVPDHFSTIQEAVNAAAAGDTIYVRPGIYYENVVVTNKSLTVQSLGGPSRTLLDGQKLGPTFGAYGIGEVNLDGFTVQNGTIGVEYRSVGNDGGDRLYGAVRNSVIVNNDRGMWLSGETRRMPWFQVVRCTIANNTAMGGLLVMMTRAEVHESVIANNHSAEMGGGISGLWAAALDVHDSFITGNSTDQSGGGVAADWHLYVRVVNSVVDRNTAAVEGGGLYGGSVSSIGSDLLIQNSTVVGNTAPVGGSVVHAGSTGKFRSMNSLVSSMNA